MTYDRIMIVRHGEKPPRDGSPPFGFTEEGERDAHSLSARGWQRAGALARLFATASDPLSRPAAVFAARPSADVPSRRNAETAAPLAALLGLDVDARFTPDRVVEAAAAMLASPRPVLAVWRHRNIAGLVSALTGDAGLVPQWDQDRFDLVLVLDRAERGWKLTQVPQKLLAGDSDAPLRLGAPEREG